MDDGSRILPATGDLGPDASLDLATKAKFGGWLTLEDWDDYLAREEEKLEQERRQLAEDLEKRKRQFEEEFGADWEGLNGNLDRRRRFEQHLQELESRLEKMAQLALELRQIEKLKEYRATLDRRVAELEHSSEELEHRKHEVHIKEEELNKLVAMQREQLQEPLLVRPDLDKHKDNDAWDPSPILWVIAVVSGLAFFVQMGTLIPPVYLKYIVVAFAVLWGLGSVALSSIIFERFRGQNTLSHHAARFAFLCFTLVVLYALYLVTLHLDAATSHASPSSASEQ